MLQMSMIKSSFPYKSFQIHLPIKIGSVWIKEQVQLPLVLSAVTFLRQKIDEHDDNDHDLKPPDQEASHTPPPTAGAYYQAHGIPGILINEVEDYIAPKTDVDKEQMDNWSPNLGPKRSFYTSASSLFTNLNRGTNTVRDSCGSLVKPQEAFGGPRADESLSPPFNDNDYHY
ncbi:unnamed protein product [Orchesella dallaii]|uniref:Uncharacterized protein n=1 Tax=Orchesella dallaii TaxID=48710 RepID=A0ABP1R2Q9_9HEXA